VKRTLLGVVSVLALAISAPLGAANAADMAVKAPPAPMPPAPTYFNWTGFYIGGNFGGAWANDSISGSSTFADPAVTTSTFSGNNSYSGIVGGGQIGANYQFPNNWVIGFEADVDGSSLSGSTTNCGVTAAGAIAGCSAINTKINDFGTVRGRLGYAVSNVLFYGTGGWAWGNSTTTSTLSCVGAGCPGTSAAAITGGSSSASTSATNGWAAGGGLEWAFNRNWSMRLEYLHLQFNGISEGFSSTGTVGAAPFTLTSSSSTNSSNDMVRVGINYIFH